MKILTLDDDIVFDLNMLTTENAAKDYARRHCKASKRYFNATEFVREYVSDPIINYDNRLCVKNAAEYFVKSFVKHKSVRGTLGTWYQFKRFMRRRMTDLIRTTPINALRTIIENKWF